MKKVLVILGPTASGKSALAVKLAKKFNGEIISADSRQVYKDLDVGSGKITKKEMGGIPHHLLDVADPKKQFNVSDFLILTKQALTMIYHSGHIPIVVGGTGFYIDVLTDNVSLPNVPPNKLLRSNLNKFSKEKLFEILKKKDRQRAKTIDPNNKVRLIRALEIVEALGKVPELTDNLQPTTYDFVFIGLKPDNLDKRIYKRLLKRLEPMIREGKRLHKQGLSYKRMYELGLEYRYIGMYLQDKISKKEMVEKLNIAIRQYAKRQITWFRRNQKIKWFTLSLASDGVKPEKYKRIERYLTKALGGR